MREFIKIETKEEILSLLYDFSDIFPHLFDKIDSIDNYAEKLLSYANFYAGIEDSKIFGIIVFYSNDKDTKTAYISLIGIKKDAQNRGFGSWLLFNCENKAKEDGMTSISLEVDLDNESAISFYKRKGYTFDKPTDRNSIYMNKHLNIGEIL